MIYGIIFWMLYSCLKYIKKLRYVCMEGLFCLSNCYTSFFHPAELGFNNDFCIKYMYERFFLSICTFINPKEFWSFFSNGSTGDWSDPYIMCSMSTLRDQRRLIWSQPAFMVDLMGKSTLHTFKNFDGFWMVGQEKSIWISLV